LVRPRRRAGRTRVGRALAVLSQALSRRAVSPLPRGLAPPPPWHLVGHAPRGGEATEPVVPRLSAIVITRNEAGNIAECLDSLAFCDERIVVDCGSTDDTVALARARGANVVHHDWEGFGAQKNYALSLAKGDWVLSLDADERVTPQLAAAINGAIADGRADGYEFPRLSSFCGRPLRHSGWHPDYVLRLFRRSRARFTDVVV